MNILRMNPVFKEKIWGGKRLNEEYGYDLPGDHIGECWAISAHPFGDCVISEGVYQGMHLSQLWECHREIFGNMQKDVFPLLTKIIDASDDLSVQVHPDDSYAAVNENGSLGKMECWYILDCEEDASIILGHNARTKEELVDMIDNNRWDELLREVPIKKGDFFQINPGTIHAIKHGTLVLESQQSSDITYRLYDYARLQEGKKRELHIDKSLDVINVPYVPLEIPSEEADSWMKKLYSCEYYNIWKADLKGEEYIPEIKYFMIGSVLEGEAWLEDELIRKGNHFIIPCSDSEIRIKGDAELIFSSPE